MAGALEMGGYGIYVWGAFALTGLVLLICYVQGQKRHKSMLKTIEQGIRVQELD